MFCKHQHGLTSRKFQTTPEDACHAPILLIDDNAVQAATRQTILKRAGYFVIAVLSPERALEQFRNNEFPAPSTSSSPTTSCPA